VAPIKTSPDSASLTYPLMVNCSGPPRDPGGFNEASSSTIKRLALFKMICRSINSNLIFLSLNSSSNTYSSGRVSTRMDSLIAKHYASLDSSLAGIGRTGQNVDVAVQNLSSASEDLKEITRRLREGEGTVGKLLADDELIDRLNTTVSKLDSLITDIKLHPGRYVTLELF